MAPLKEVIGNARIVQLGEQSHGDGACFETKIRLIKFLHQEMGFDVIAFESGLYDCQRSWVAFQNGDDPLTAARLGVFGIWTGSAQTTSLWNYLSQQANTERPLELVGFDCQFTGAASREHLFDDLRELANKIGLQRSDEDWQQFETQLNSLLVPKKPEGQLENFLGLIDQLRETMGNAKEFEGLNSRQVGFWQQELASLADHCRRKWDPNPAGNVMEQVNQRDAQMAENLLWIANEGYPGKKIIVWAASFHIARNLAQIKVPGGQISYDTTIPMGHHVHQKLSEETFSVGFTALQGQAGAYFRPAFDLTLAPEGTLESICQAAGLQNGLIPLRGTDAESNWLRQAQFARPLGYTWMEAVWPDHFDAMIFNQTMTPSTRAGKD